MCVCSHAGKLPKSGWGWSVQQGDRPLISDKLQAPKLGKEKQSFFHFTWPLREKRTRSMNENLKVNLTEILSLHNHEKRRLNWFRIKVQFSWGSIFFRIQAKIQDIQPSQFLRKRFCLGYKITISRLWNLISELVGIVWCDKESLLCDADGLITHRNCQTHIDSHSVSTMKKSLHCKNEYRNGIYKHLSWSFVDTERTSKRFWCVAVNTAHRVVQKWLLQKVLLRRCTILRCPPQTNHRGFNSDWERNYI